VNKPLVSIIIPVKNGEQFLSQAITSIIKQDYEHFEILVVDGQSTDKTAEIAKSFTQVRYLYQEGNPGIANARNLGIEWAKGQLISFISHDDLWAPNKLSLQVEYLLQNPKAGYVVTLVKFFLEPGSSVPTGFRIELLDKSFPGYMPETLMARKSLFDKIGRFNPNLELLEDNDWFSRARDGKISFGVVSEVLVYKRVHTENISLCASRAGVINRELLKVARNSIKRKRGKIGEKTN